MWAISNKGSAKLSSQIIHTSVALAFLTFFVLELFFLTFFLIELLFFSGEDGDPDAFVFLPLLPVLELLCFRAVFLLDDKDNANFISLEDVPGSSPIVLPAPTSKISRACS